jgi:hypothetical protein
VEAVAAAQLDAEAVAQLDAGPAVLAADAALRPDVAAERQEAGHGVAASAFHQGRLRPAPAPAPAGQHAPVIQSLPSASPTRRSSQAARDEVWSCDLVSQYDLVGRAMNK